MKITALILLISISLTSCHTSNTNVDKVTQYYNAFNVSNYDQIKSLITDSIVITEGDYVMPYSHETFHEHFKWDSVFQPSYRIIDLLEKNDKVIATVEVHSLRFKFLKNNPLTCKHQISFRSGKLNKFENLDCINADWSLWEKERDSLVQWTKIHHPELDGFINDLTMNGAINYLKAIELYTLREQQ